MLWRGRRQSDNIQDSRGAGGGGECRGGGGFGRNPIRIPIGGRAGGGGLSDHHHPGRAVLRAQGLRHRPAANPDRWRQRPPACQAAADR